jgi:hypothetical protein
MAMQSPRKKQDMRQRERLARLLFSGESASKSSVFRRLARGTANAQRSALNTSANAAVEETLYAQCARS